MKACVRPLLVLLSTLPLAGSCCSAATADESALSVPPPPFALQFVGTYVRDGRAKAESGVLESVDLARDGTYGAVFDGVPGVQRGAYRAAATRRLPLRLTFDDGAPNEDWSLTIVAYDGRALAEDRDELRATGSVGPNEGLCEATGGAWLDDDPDPRTGLYCLCPAAPAPDEYIPSQGGCVP
jgi:hypothetical protein